MDSINNLLVDYQKRHGLGNTLSAARIVEVANSVADGKYRAVSFCSGRLKVEVPVGPALFFFKKDQAATIANINKALGDNKIDRLVVRGK